MNKIILAVVVVAVGVAGYFAFVKESPQVAQQTNTPTPTKTVQATKSPTATPNKTVGWKTYTNTQYGFEFKYPSDWIKDSNNFYSPQAPKGIYGVVDKISVGTFTNSGQLSIKDWRAKNIGDVIIKDNGPVSIAGAIAHQYVDGGMVNLIDTYISKGTTVVVVGVSQDTAYLEVYNQILSTFKFTK